MDWFDCLCAYSRQIPVGIGGGAVWRSPRQDPAAGCLCLFCKCDTSNSSQMSPSPETWHPKGNCHLEPCTIELTVHKLYFRLFHTTDRVSLGYFCSAENITINHKSFCRCALNCACGRSVLVGKVGAGWCGGESWLYNNFVPFIAAQPWSPWIELVLLFLKVGKLLYKCIWHDQSSLTVSKRSAGGRGLE